MTRFWDGRTDVRTDRQTDGVTALLDLLSPLATQVKNVSNMIDRYLVRILLLKISKCQCFGKYIKCKVLGNHLIYIQN